MAARLRRHLPGKVQRALEAADYLMQSDSSRNIHSVGWGVVEMGGIDTGQVGVVATVEKKGKLEKSFPGSPLIPSALCGFRTDVQERPRQEIELLKCIVPCDFYNTESIHQDCYDTPIPGGVEIFPIGKQWLGTLGCKVVYRCQRGNLCHGAITNWHVATGDIGTKLGQPGGNNEWFARVNHSPGVSFSGVNYVDLAVLDIERVDGKYAPQTHTVKAEQVTLGEYQRDLSTGGVGTIVARDGRTLGRITNGRISQIGVNINVGYGEGGVATFSDQLIVAGGGGGNFSAPGDSGSMVFEWPSMRPSGLLFAGGGGTTVVSPAEFILEFSGVHSFQ